MTKTILYARLKRRKVKTKNNKNKKMAEGTIGTILPPNLKTADEYRDFMRSEAGSQIKPGSDAEKEVLSKFKEARALGHAATQGGRTESIQQELKKAEEGQSYIRPEDSQAARREITITQTGEQGPQEVPVTSVPGPLEANNNPDTGIIDPAKLEAAAQTAPNTQLAQMPEINPNAPVTNPDQLPPQTY